MKINKDFRFKDGYEDEGVVEGYLSTYGNVDRVGDIIVKGAFDESLKRKRTIPMCFNHQWDTVIGKMELSSDNFGLLAKGTFNMSDPFAKKTFELVKMGAIDSLSIGMLVQEFESMTRGIKILKADIFEGSIVTVPANPQAMITGNKSTERKRLELEIQIAILQTKMKLSTKK